MYACVCVHVCVVLVRSFISCLSVRRDPGVRERGLGVCTSLCVCGCVWSGLHASFRGWGVLASQSNPNLAKFGGGWPVSIFVKLCVLILSARLVSLCCALQVVRV